MSGDSPTEGKEIWIIYDGECPFCSRYVLMYQIKRHVERVHLIDARSDHPIVQEIRALKLNLDNGMAVKWNGKIYHGAAAIHLLGLLGTSDSAFNWINSRLFARPKLARLLYPLLVRGRRITLWALGRKPIADF
jgi:predicted DCC family thiol-disulfide oxidoreductase YuxK